MQLILPDVLSTARGLSVGAAGFLLLVGALMWAAGWRWHRFWVVFGLTLAAGLVGLGAGSAAGGQQILVVGVLLAVSAGMLALELSKVLAFVTGGVAAWVAVQAVLPQAQELWAVFLSGGLLGVVLYRLWTMLTTSFLGILVAWHAGFVLLESLSLFDSSKWVAENTAALNGGVIAATLIGVLVQAKTAPRADSDASSEESLGHGKDKNPKKKPAATHDEEPQAASAWWKRVVPGHKAA